MTAAENAHAHRPARLQPGEADTDGGDFCIPAEAGAHQELIRWDVPDQNPELSVWLLLNHMHDIGVDMKVWVEHAEEQEDPCLLQTPEWDFDWQQSFYYDAAADNAPVLRGGDTLWLAAPTTTPWTTPRWSMRSWRTA